MRNLAALTLLFSVSVWGASVKTIAGTGVSGATGDGGPAAKAQVGNPYGLTIGPDGALYVCEIDTHRVRRIDLRTGRISTVAGSGALGNSGDGGLATEAAVNEPYEVRFDKHGNLFFVDMKNANVRRVDAKTGIISTVAGTGEMGFSGDGGAATLALFKQPHSIAFDKRGDLYVCDIGNNRIRKIDMRSGLISTFAGTGEKLATSDGAPLAGTPLNGPRAMAFDKNGDMYLALREGNQVWRLDRKAQTWRHVAGTGEKGYQNGPDAKKATLSGPKGIEVGPDRAVYIADTESHTIRRIDLATGAISTVAGVGERNDGLDGDPLQCGLARPHGVYVDKAGVVYIGDSENHRVRVVK
ncbi:MAG: SMP-30/gluconolactonase/LRE family protein [Acidobacteria bacterium]|nr:SMP-30/gluconolactonase/LRE family protein [Acidobacteriota bacterium]